MCTLHSPTAKGFSEHPLSRCGHAQSDEKPVAGAESNDSYKDLFEASVLARESAYAPNTGFKVGAALRTRDGKVYTGSNKELTINADHAEQTALHKALADGQKPEDLMAIAIFGARGEVSDKNFDSRTAACGNCRQALFDLNPQMVLVGSMGRDTMVVTKLSDELPGAYHRKRELPTPPPAVPHQDPLIAGALQARSRSYVPRTGFPVGAAVLTDKGIFTGAQTEISSYASQAARMALGAALEAGATHILKLAIIGGTQSEKLERPKDLPYDTFEALYELSPDAAVVLPDEVGQLEEHPASDFPKFLKAG
jgi:cytidine deaminase